MNTRNLRFTAWLRGYTSFFGAMLFSLTFAVAQERTITGVVTDEETGETLPGVSVLIEGTSNGTITDIEGNYKLNVGADASLTFSFIGYSPQTVQVGSKNTIDVGLPTDVQSLDEVVIVDYGYGSMKKSDNTGSVATISGAELKKIPFASTAQALTGRLPGVNILTTDGSPDAEVVIRVRGGGFITQDNSPLFVVDGFIVSSIRDIPPSDIESITVLKDAAATAIYGAQAANGVVVVRTTTPKAGKVSVSYNGFLQYKFLPENRQYDVLSPYEYVLANYEIAKLRSEADLRNFEKFFGTYEDLELYQNKPGTNWQDELFGGSRLSQYHNVSISGGSEMTKISLSVTTNDDEGILEGNGYERNVINFKLQQKITDRLRFDAGARITNTVVDGAGTSGNAQLNIKDAIQTRPVNGIADELDIDLTTVSSDDDYQAFLLSLINPTELLEQDWRQRTTNSYVFNSSLNWEVIDNLNVKTTFTGEKEYDENLRYYGYLTSEAFNNGLNNDPLGERREDDEFTYRWLNTASYVVPGLNQHELKILLGQEIYSSGGFRNSLRAEGFRRSITPEEMFANLAFGQEIYISSSQFTNSNRFSMFGRLDYQFMGKYLAAFTLRSDASSRFSKENRVGAFPALALGWKLSEEGFMSGASFVDELKFRVSIGATGNDRISSTATQFLFQASDQRGPGFGNQVQVYYRPDGETLYNPDLVWETTINRNAGLDFSFFKARLAGNFDVYWNTTQDLLLRSAIPSNTGFSDQWNNIGQTSNKGIELGLTGYVIEKRDFTLSANFNFGLNRANIDELDGTNERFFQSNWASTDLNGRDDFYLKVGGTIGDIYGYVTDGYYTVDDFASYDETTGDYILADGVPNSTAISGNTDIRPGFLKLKDIDGDGDVDSEDRMVIGNTLPKAQGGFGFNARLKGFDAQLFFNWSYGNDVYNTGKIQFNQFRRVNYGNMLETMSSENRFSYIDLDGSVTGTPGEEVTDLAALGQMNVDKNIWSHHSFGIANAVIHNWAVEDGSFLRLNQVSLGYSLPKGWIQRFGLSQFRIYATGNNLHIWTNYSGFDPEVSTGRNSGYSGLTPGVDYSSFPRSRSYTFGVNMTF